MHKKAAPASGVEMKGCAIEELTRPEHPGCSDARPQILRWRFTISCRVNANKTVETPLSHNYVLTTRLRRSRMVVNEFPSDATTKLFIGHREKQKVVLKLVNRASGHGKS